MGSFVLPICTLLCLMGPASAQYVSGHMNGVILHSFCIARGRAPSSGPLTGLLDSQLTQPGCRHRRHALAADIPAAQQTLRVSTRAHACRENGHIE